MPPILASAEAMLLLSSSSPMMLARFTWGAGAASKSVVVVTGLAKWARGGQTHVHKPPAEAAAIGGSSAETCAKEHMYYGRMTAQLLLRGEDTLLMLRGKKKKAGIKMGR